MMLTSFLVRTFRKFSALFILIGCVLCQFQLADASVHGWDNWTGDQQFSTTLNWIPTTGAPPGPGDTAIFDGQLGNLGVGDNTVQVDDETEINDMQIYDSSGFPSTVVDLTIGDGTPASRFDLDDTIGPSLVVGSSFGDTATLNLLGGRLDTWEALIGGRAIINVINPGSLWDTTDVTIAGDTTANTAGVGLGLRAQIASHGHLTVGSDTSSGRIVVESTGIGVTPSRWTVDGTVSIGPPTAFNFNAGTVTLQTGGQMNVGQDVNVHGGEPLSTLTVQSGAELNVGDTISIQESGVLELRDAASTVMTSDIDIDGGSLDWTGGTLHVTEGEVKIENTSAADLDTDQLTIDSGMKLVVSSTASPAHALRVGDTGTGTLFVQNGGIIESYHGTVGFNASASGNATVTGGGSRWEVTEDIKVGSSNNAVGSLHLSDGAVVTANSIYLGREHVADGTVTVDASTLTSAAVMAVGGFIADNGAGAAAGGSGQLTVQDGGVVDVAGTLIAFGGDRINLNGSGSTVSADVIRLEPFASLVDSGGTLVRANRLFGFGTNANFVGNLHIGRSGGTGFGQHTVDAGVTLTVGANLVVGTDAPGTLRIHDGTVNSNVAMIGGAAGADGSSAVIDTSGSRWFSQEIYVGGDGSNPQATAVLHISNDAQVIVSDRVKVWGPGAVVLDSGLISTDVVEIEGELIGEGAILLGGGPTTVANNGIVAPGLSPGVLLINGNASTIDSYVQGSGGRLVIEIGGATPGLYDRLDVVGGSAVLDGFLDVLLIDPFGGSDVFVPHAGDSFEILTADGGLGGTTFDTVPADLPTLTGDLMWDIVYGSDFVRLDVSTPYSADFDGDGDVDGDDLSKWQGDYGGPGSDADGDSDGADFLAWQQQYGSGVVPLASSRGIPEPSTLMLIVGINAIALSSRRKLRAIH